MEIDELLHAGADILGAVSDAVDTGDYSNLAWEVQDIVSGTSRGSGRTQQRGRQQASGGAGRTGTGTDRSGVGTDGASPAQRGSRSRNSGAQEGQQRKRSFFAVQHPDRRRGMVKRYAGLIGACCGALVTALTVLFFLAAAMQGLHPNFRGITWLLTVIVLTVLCWVISRKGKREQELIAHFYQYAGAIGTREFISVAGLSDATGISAERIRKDMKELRAEGIVPFVAMDRNETTVIFSARMYREYERSEEARLAREQEEKAQQKKQREQAENGEKSSRGRGRTVGKERRDNDGPGKDAKQENEADQLIREGNDAIRTIREINDRIPDDYEMSDKLYRLENVMKGIFDRIRKEPAKARDIRKLMNYYLPTTIKILKAYEELGGTPSGGGTGNADETRRQIEAAMDTINDAFEKLLDDLLEDQAWDIASDISVMKTMMAQDGLVEEATKSTERETEPAGSR